MKHAYIKEDKDEALWLVIDGETTPENELRRYTTGFSLADRYGAAYPVLDDEVEAIREACDEYLGKKEPVTELKLAINLLRSFNKWRRGGEGEQPKPEDIGAAIEFAIQYMEGAINE